MPTVTYISDIHLEFYDRTLPLGIDLKGGDILCLAGDIGCPESRLYFTFLAYCSPLFKYIFIITGNHEYYKTTAQPLKTIDNTNEKIIETNHGVSSLVAVESEISSEHLLPSEILNNGRNK